MHRHSLFSAALCACALGIFAPSTFADFLIGGPAQPGDAPGSSSHRNGNLDLTHADEIVPSFFLPKPNVWVYQGFRTISGPYQDGLSSEGFAGQAPTPVTTDGNLNGPPPQGYGGSDGGVFYKPFTGNATDGPATIHLFQSFPATPGTTYQLTGWAGAEANMLGTAQFGIEFQNASGVNIPGALLNLNTAGLFVPNGQPFNYKEYTLTAVAPIGATSVIASSSLLNALGNPAGGGQAFVVDDFTFQSLIPEPSVLGLALPLLFRRRRRA